MAMLNPVLCSLFVSTNVLRSYVLGGGDTLCRFLPTSRSVFFPYPKPKNHGRTYLEPVWPAYGVDYTSGRSWVTLHCTLADVVWGNEDSPCRSTSGARPSSRLWATAESHLLLRRRTFWRGSTCSSIILYLKLYTLLLISAI
jgi:hypothetical protein